MVLVIWQCTCDDRMVADTGKRLFTPSSQMSNFAGAYLDISKAVERSSAAALRNNRGVISQFMKDDAAALADYRVRGTKRDFNTSSQL